MILSDEAIRLIKEYADENMSMCMDNVHCDPILNGEVVTQENILMSEDMTIQSTIHSAKYHAAKDILSLCGVDDNLRG